MILLLNDLLELELESEDYDSLGGLVIGLLDHLPAVGEQVSENGFTFVVEAVDKNRIEWVHLFLPEPEEETKETEKGTHIDVTIADSKDEQS